LSKWFICVALCFIFLLQSNENNLDTRANKLILPGMQYSICGETKKMYVKHLIKKILPLYEYVTEHEPTETIVEDSLTYEMLLSIQANDEYSMTEEVQEEKTEPVIALDKLRDFDYLLNHFYIVDSTTTIGADQLNVDDFMSRNMKIDTSTSGPKVLIFHTHSQEAFIDSVSGDSSTSIVGMGTYLSELLNMKGIESIHHAGVYDLINGKLDRSSAYQMAEAGVRDILKKYPTIEVVIDLHRDGVPETTHLVKNVNGKDCAKIMFFNGLSRTKKQGNIAYLANPYIQDNLAFSFQMQLASEQLYPGLARKIYLKGYRYSLHMMPKSLLIEAGAQTNTVQEMKNTMELLANILSEVLL